MYVLMISETKTDCSFPSAQFHQGGYATQYRLDRNENGVGTILYIKEDIPSTLVISNLSIEGFFVEIKLRIRHDSFAVVIILTRA